MNEMVERVARVVASNCECGGSPDPDRVPCGRGCNCEQTARAAIKAMREPTEAMEQAGFYAGPCEIVPPLPYTGPDSTVMAPLVWRAMIDKALK